MSARRVPTDLFALIGDTVREATRSWRLPATLALGLGFGLMEYNYTDRLLGFLFGPAASMYTLWLGPLPWRALVPLEEDGHRIRKLLQWLLAASIATALFAVLVVSWRSIAHVALLDDVYVLGHGRELLVSYLLFLVGGWGLARDIQLEQRLDRTLGSHLKLSVELEEARLHALRADLDPHFLFNALNAIASLCASDPVAAEANVVRLAALLRAVLDTRRRPLHPLEDELALAGDYVGLLAARYPTLKVNIDADVALRSVTVPPLVLQPLLENAVRHGHIEAGVIHVRAQAVGVDLVLSVESPGSFRGRRDGGMGIDLVQRRVELAWGADGEFTIGPDGEGTMAKIIAHGVLATPPTVTRS